MEEVQRIQQSFGEVLRNGGLAWVVGAVAIIGAVIAHKTGVLPDFPGLEVINTPVSDPSVKL